MLCETAGSSTRFNIDIAAVPSHLRRVYLQATVSVCHTGTEDSKTPPRLALSEKASVMQSVGDMYRRTPCHALSSLPMRGGMELAAPITWPKIKRIVREPLQVFDDARSAKPSYIAHKTKYTGSF